MPLYSRNAVKMLIVYFQCLTIKKDGGEYSISSLDVVDTKSCGIVVSVVGISSHSEIGHHLKWSYYFHCCVITHFYQLMAAACVPVDKIKSNFVRAWSFEDNVYSKGLVTCCWILGKHCAKGTDGRGAVE